MLRFWLHAPLLVLVLSLWRPVRAGEVPTAPLLRIEAGMHTAEVNDGDADDAGRFVVSGSDDKTVRVWNTQTGDLLQTLRPPIGAGEEGKIDATSIAPDGNTIACGGSTGAQWDDGNTSVYFFDRASGALTRRIGGLPGKVQSLKFSRDGARLAVGLQNAGLRVFRARDGVLLGQDEGDDDFAALDFARDGRLSAARTDGFVRLYDAQNRLITKVQPLPGMKILALRFSPDAQRLAIVGAVVEPDVFPATQLAVLDGKTLAIQWKSAPETEKTYGFQGSVAWTNDGKLLSAGNKKIVNGFSLEAWSALPQDQQETLLRGGLTQNEFDALPAEKRQVALNIKSQDYIRHWAKPESAGFRDINYENVNAMITLRDGSVVWEGDAGEIGLLEKDGRARWKKQTVTANFQSAESVRVAQDGASIEFAFLDGRTSSLQTVYDAAGTHNQTLDGSIASHFSVVKRGFQPIGTQTLADPQQSAEGWEIEAAMIGPPKINGQAVDLKPFEIALEFAIAPDGKSLLLGTSERLLRLDRAGKALWQLPAPSSVANVNISGDGRLVVAAFDDGTIRWYRASDGVELLAFFPHADRKRWVLWTPAGYYDCSPGGEDLIGWHVNNGRDKAADFFPASRFRETFYRPDIVGHVLQTLDVEKARVQADAALGKIPIPAADAARVIETKSPPVVRFIKPLDTIETKETKLTLRYALRTPSGEPVTAVQILVDGRPVAGESDLNVAPGKEGEIERSVEVTLPDRDCEVGLLAINRYSFSVPAFLKVWRGQGRGVRLESAAPGVATAQAAGLGKLWVLAVGVEKYDPSLPQLQYSIDDAQAIVKAMEGQDKARGGPYQAVETKLLPDADRVAILGGLKWLQQNVVQGDRAIIFLAGHGVNTAEGYYFLPSGCARDEYDSNGLPFSKFVSVAPTIKGQVLFLVDTCRSANIMGGAGDFNAALNRLSEPGKGWSVMAASQGDQTAQESGKWGHGAFTRAILEGFDGQGDAATKDGFIYIKRLSSYVDIRVAEMTGGGQTPAFTSFSQSEQLLGRQLAERILVSRRDR